MTQASLFDYPNVAGAKTGGTSLDAAKAIEATGRAATLREDVERLFRSGFVGTADECAARLREPILAIRPRVSELRTKGLLIETGERRRSEGGRMASVWRAA